MSVKQPLDWLRSLLIVLLAIQILLYFFWQATQFETVAGTWYQVLFQRSGPVVLPIMFGVELVLFGLALPLAWAERQTIRQNLPSLLLLAVVAGGLLTIPLAYLNHFDQTKLWKDVAFLLGFLTAPVVLLFPRRVVRGFFFYYLSLALLAGIFQLAEAIHRAAMLGATPGQFLLHTYRIFAGGESAELLLLFGAVAILSSYPRPFRRVLYALLCVAIFYVGIRFRLDLTRLNWISLGIALPIIVLFLLPRRALRSGLFLTLAMAALFLLTSLPIAAMANGTDLGSRFRTTQDVSIDYRFVESRILLQKVASRPLTGWGPGGTISPHVASEPLRNNTSSFFDGYLGIPYKFGLIVFAVLLAAVIAAILTTWRGLKRDLPPVDAALAAGAAAYLVGVLTTSPASDVLFANFSGLSVGLMIGISSRLVRRERLASG